MQISGKAFCFEFEFQYQMYWTNCNVSYYIDSEFGADSDGNRGITKMTIEDVEVLRVEDMSGVTIEPEEVMIEAIKEEAVNRF